MSPFQEQKCVGKPLPHFRSLKMGEGKEAILKCLSASKPPHAEQSHYSAAHQ